MIISPELNHPFMVGRFEITLLTPVKIKVIFPVPWPEDHLLSFEEKLDLNYQLERLIRYLLAEDMIFGSGTGIDVHIKYNSNGKTC